LSPAYDLINSTIALHTTEEMALPLKGKKSNLKRKDLLNYFGRERLGLTDHTINEQLLIFQNALERWENLISQSFLSPKAKQAYLSLLQDRWKKIF